MFGRKLKDLSIVVDCLCGDSNRAPNLVANVLEVVELSPALRAAPICWVLSGRILAAGRDTVVPQLVRRIENFGDSVATSGYRGIVHGSLQRSELLREVGWAAAPPGEVTGSSSPPAELFFPREPDERSQALAEDLGLPYFEGIGGGGDLPRVRFFLGDRLVEVDGVIFSGASVPSKRPSTPRSRRRAFRALVPTATGGDSAAAVVFQLLYEADIAAVRYFAEIAEESAGRAAVLPIQTLLSSARSSDAGSPADSGDIIRRSPGDQAAFLKAADLRGQATSLLSETVLTALDPAFDDAPSSRETSRDGVPVHRELAVPMTGQAILEESGLHAVFEEGRLRRVSIDGEVLLDGRPTRSWISVGGERVELEMADAISFQNDISRGLRSSFVTAEGAPLGAGLLIDALVMDGSPVLFLEAYLSFSDEEKAAYVNEVVPLAIGLGSFDAPDLRVATIKCRYPDGEEHERSVPRSGLFGSRFTIETSSRSVSIAYLHPTRRYVGEARAFLEDDGRNLSLGLGPLLRGVPASAVNNLCQRFVIAICAADHRLPDSTWSSELGIPGLWSSRRDGEVKG